MLAWKAQTDTIRRLFINTLLQNWQRDAVPGDVARGLLTNFINDEVIFPLNDREAHALSHCLEALFDKLTTTAIDTGFATSYLARLTDAAVNDRAAFRAIVQQC